MINSMFCMAVIRTNSGKNGPHRNCDGENYNALANAFNFNFISGKCDASYSDARLHSGIKTADILTYTQNVRIGTLSQPFKLILIAKHFGRQFTRLLVHTNAQAESEAAREHKQGIVFTTC